MKFDHITSEAMALITAINTEMAALPDEQLTSPLVKAVRALVHGHIGEGKAVDQPCAVAPATVRGRVRGNLITIERETE
jgi:hypothetical protein